MKRTFIFTEFVLALICMLIYTEGVRAAETVSKGSGIFSKRDKTVAFSEKKGRKVRKMEQNNSWWIYFGNSTGKPTDAMTDNNVSRSTGIYVGRFDSKTGSVSDIRLAQECESSNFFAQNDRNGMLYVSGKRTKKDPDSLLAYKINGKTGDLTFVNSQPTNGNGICHVAISDDGKFLTGANYSSGDFSVFPLNTDGSIGKLTGFVKKSGGGPDKRRQTAAFGHAGYFVRHKGSVRMLMVDLGSDKVYIQKLDEKTGVVSDDPEIPVLETPAGAGPRHLTWRENKKGNLVVFVLNELQSTLSVFELQFKSEGAAESRAICLGTWTTIPESWRTDLTDEVALVDGKKYQYGNKTAEIELIDFDAPMLYVSNRGHNSIGIFNVANILNGTKDAVPELVDLQPTFGTFPRFFRSDPTGRFLLVCNKKTGTVVVFALDQHTGKMTPINQEPIRIAWPLALGFFPIEK